MIEYRGQRVDGKGWAYGYLLDKNKIGVVNYDGMNLEADWSEVIPETVGQFIRLHDKTLKKIYGSIEINGQMSKGGDILSLKATDFKTVQHDWRGIVVFGNPNGAYSWGWQLKPIGETICNPEILLWVETELPNVSCEVIGNIPDNPELLEVHK